MKRSDVFFRSGADVDWLRRYVKDVILPFEAAHVNDDSFEPAIFADLQRMGFAHAMTPVDCGGGGLPLADLIWMFRELAGGSSGIAASMLGNALGITAVESFAPDEVRKNVLSAYLRAPFFWSFAMSEAEAGSDVSRTLTRASDLGGEIEVVGQKDFITNFAHSKCIVVFAKMVGDSGRDQGLTCFLIDASAADVRRGKSLVKAGWRHTNTGTLHFDSVKVPKTNQIGEPGMGYEILSRCLSRSKTLMAAMAVGVASRAIEITQDRLRSTERFGKPLIEQSAIRHELARMCMQLESAWTTVCRSALCYDERTGGLAEAAMAKMLAGAAVVRIVDRCVELFGSRGLLDEYEISRLARDAKFYEILEGPTFVQEIIVARERIPRTQMRVISNVKKAA